MKLLSARVREFKSIRDSTPFTLGDITCLVGRNESGKTAILQALYRLNPLLPEEGEFDVTDDYPRKDVEDYNQDLSRSKRDHAIVTTATFELSGDDLSEVQKSFGSAGFPSKIELLKGYENKLQFNMELDEKQILLGFIHNSPIPEALRAEFEQCNSFSELATAFLKQPKPEFEQVRQQLEAIAKSGIESYLFNNFLLQRLPKFFYFDEYYQIQGVVNIEFLKQRMTAVGNPPKQQLQPPDHPTLGLIDRARLNLDDLINPKSTEWLNNKLEGASNYFTKRALKYWTQNKHIDMKFDVRPARPGDPPGMQSGTNLWTRVYDTKHKVSTQFGTRSRGFIWFFSFLAWFSKIQNSHQNVPLIFLLDEPGLFLHGDAQADLLLFMQEELLPNQVIYTTHSPFMVDSRHFERVRIVEDKSMLTEAALPREQEGTKVHVDVMEVSSGSLFPLQGALGYELCQTLFVGPNVLVVEGVSDLLYLQTISSILQRLGRVGLSEKWTITPVGGIDKVPAFVALFGAQRNLMIATLTDIQKQNQQTLENLYRKKLLEKNRVLTFAQFTGASEADIEDMFPRDFYLSLVNSEFQPHLATPVSLSALSPQSPHILPALEAHFNEAPLTGAVKFNHYRPARYFATNSSALEASIPALVLNRFESAFKVLNALL